MRASRQITQPVFVDYRHFSLSSHPISRHRLAASTTHQAKHAMLFDTPLLDVPAASTSQNPASGKETAAQKGAPGNKRRRSSTGGDVAPAPDALADAAGPAFNVDKLLKKMHQAGSAPRDGKPPVAANKAPQQPQDGPSKKRQKGAAAEKPPARADVPKEKAVQATPAGEGKRAKKAKNKEKKAAAGGAAPNGAGEAVSAQLPVSSTSQSSQQDTPRGKHAAPAQVVVGSSATASAKKGSVQDKLRAQLAGGKFRMLNEQLYTTSGDDAHRLMKEDAAFDDVSLAFLTLPANPGTDSDTFHLLVPHWVPVPGSNVAGPPARVDRAVVAAGPRAELARRRLWLRRRRPRADPLSPSRLCSCEYDLPTAADPVAQGPSQGY